jgi:hypothetical protein
MPTKSEDNLRVVFVEIVRGDPGVEGQLNHGA